MVQARPGDWRVIPSQTKAVVDRAFIFLFPSLGSKTLQETRVLLLRHAETSAPNIFHGAESDVGLSAWGEKQAVLLADHLRSRKPEAIYCSAMRRAVATAEPIGRATALSPTIVPSLHERRIGPLSGLSRDEGWAIYDESRRRWIAGELESTHEGGESFADIRRRVLPFFRELPVRHPGKTIIVVAHGVVIRVVVLSLIDGLDAGDFDRIAIDFASINDLGWDGRGWRAHALNHLVAPSPGRPVA
jgi:probable phosphoglycerate mutase